MHDIRGQDLAVGDKVLASVDNILVEGSIIGLTPKGVKVTYTLGGQSTWTIVIKSFLKIFKLVE